MAAAVVVAVGPALGAGAASAAPGQSADEQVIVQFADAPAVHGETALYAADPGARVRAEDNVRARRDTLRDAHKQFLTRATAAGVHATVRHDYTELYDGMALSVPANQVARLAGLPGVVAVHPDRAVHASGDLTLGPVAAVTDPATVEDDVAQIGAPAVWATKDAQGRPDTGTGQVIAVVDTGIAYNHPDLGGGFGPGHKVVGGYDFVNGDSDPMDDYGHGTHVAGIAAGAAAAAGGRTGVAPGASLTAYKVLDAWGYGSDSTVIAGIEAAVSVDNPYRASVVNLSLGGPGDGADPVAQACEAAVAAGVVVVAAAGNDGPGESTVGSPGAAPDVLTVGASVTGIAIPSIALVSPEKRAIASTRLNLSDNPPASPSTLDVVDMGNGDDSNYEGKDVTGKAVLVAYNSWMLFQDAQTAAAHGAAAILFATPDYYTLASNGGPGLSGQPEFATGNADTTRLGLVAVVINGQDATEMKNGMASGPVRIEVTGTDATDLMPSFSSHGPASPGYSVKPDLVAPGVEIRSTVPGGYERMSGTSMATPHVTGAVALLRQAHPDWSVAQVAAALTGSAHLLNGYEPQVQGAGRLDVAAADRADVVARPRVAGLGLADMSGANLSTATTVTLTNPTGSAVDLSLTTQPVPGRGVTATVSPTTVRLAAGGQASVRLSLAGPVPATSTDVGGWLRATGPAGTPGLSVPYLLAVRPLQLHATPDPSTSGSELFIYAEPPVSGTPSVTVTGPDGRSSTYQATADHPHWWRVAVTGSKAGVYRVAASVKSADGPTIAGTTSFEVLADAHGVTAGAWQPVGPDGEGGPIAVSPTRPGRMYALPGNFSHAVVFRTDDSGATWHEERNFPVGDGAGVAVAVDPHEPDTVYLALDGGGNDPTYQGRLLTSKDAGKTWTTLPFPDQSMRDVSTDASGQVIVVSTYTGVYVSPDRGRTFNPLPMPSTFVYNARMIGSDVYAATSDGLYVIRDAAGHPARARLVYKPDGWNTSVFYVAGTGSHVFAETSDKVVASADNGATWSTAFTVPDDDYFLATLQLVGDDLYVASYEHIWVDHGLGGTFTAVPTPVEAGYFRVAGWPTGGGGLAVAVDGVGVWRSDDSGKSYQRIGLPATTVPGLGVATDPNGRTVLTAASAHGAYSTPLPTGTADAALRDWGLNGHEAGIGDNSLALAVSPGDPHVVLRAAKTGFGSRWALTRSTDGGATWTTVLIPRVSGRATSIVVDQADPNRMYVSYLDGIGPGVLVSRDAGLTWTAVPQQQPVTAMATDPVNPDRIWMGGPTGLYRSDDAGRTAQRVQTLPVTALAVDPRDPSHLIVGGSALYDSPDAGVTLRKAGAADLRMKVTAFAFAPDGTVFAATGATMDANLPVGGRGVLRSDDGGRTWDNISVGLPNLDVLSLASTSDGHWLFAGTDGGGVYRLGIG